MSPAERKNERKTARTSRTIVRIVGTARRLVGAVIPYVFYWPYILRFKLFGGNSRKLHLGCGKNKFPGWINADLTLDADLIVFLQRKLPFRAQSINFIYSEHVLEHVTYEAGVSFLREAARVLKPAGVIRIAMPDLDDLLEGYQQDWRRFDWVNWPGHEFIRTRAQMINMAFRWWGHRHLYNREELARALEEAGFSRYHFTAHGESDYPPLQGLETRLDSVLVAEAVKL